MDQMKTSAVVFEAPGKIALRAARLREREKSECLIESQWSGISTGTERLMLTGQMPSFPGLGYPLVPGYETIGRVLEVSKHSALSEGDYVFAPGSKGFTDARNLFGGSAKNIICHEDKVIKIPKKLASDGVLLALAATALHILRRCEKAGAPELIVGHGVLGQLLARLVRLIYGTSPTVWERDFARYPSDAGYLVCDESQDPRTDYSVVCDVSGSDSALNKMISRCATGATVVLGGFYSNAATFDFPPAFMREINLIISAEWLPEDLTHAARLASDGSLDLSDLVTDILPAKNANEAYDLAFNNSSCLKMVIDWK